MKQLIVFLLVASVVTVSCKKKSDEPCPCTDVTNPICENYDPCHGGIPSASFFMEEANDLRGFIFPDSVFANGFIRFRSHLSDTEYKHRWYVGTEVFKDDSITPSRSFKFVTRPATITISHVIEYLPNSACFPADDGYDSVAQSFRLVKNYGELQTYGVYRGVKNGETDSFNLEFHPLDYQGNPYPDVPDLYENQFINFNNEGDTLYTIRTLNQPFSASLFNHDFFFDYDANDNRFDGRGHVDDEGNIKLEYTRFDRPDQPIVFTGIKIN